MSAPEIPGYFYDEDKKRYFKIMPTGNYSMAAIQQADRQRKKQQQHQQKEQRRRLSKKTRSLFDSTSMLTFQRQRSIYSSLPTRTLIGYGSKSMYAQLNCQGKIQLGLLEENSDNMDDNAAVTNMVVNSYSALHQQQQDQIGDTQGDIVIGHRGGLTRYGFQVEPFFQTWKSSQTWHKSTSITSLHFVPPSHGHIATSFGDDWTQSVIGTSMGDNRTLPNQLWRYTLPLSPPIDESTAERLLNNNTNMINNTNRIAPALDPILLPEPIWDCSFVRRKDTFWSSYVADPYNIILVGGDKDLFILSSSFDFISQVPCKSSVFATQLSEKQPRIAWIGCRDGRILLVDNRQNTSSSKEKHLMGNLQFRQGSAITHLKSLENYSSGHSVLAAGMDGSIALWDTRFSIPATTPPPLTSKSARRHKKKSYQQNHNSKPLQQFYGHSNNHSRHLAFDVDTNLQLITMAGDDNVVRLWSLSDQENEVHPFWHSKSYDGQVCQAKIIARPPPAQKIWSHFYDGDNDGLHTYKRSNPGLLVCGPSPSLDWFSIPH